MIFSLLGIKDYKTLKIYFNSVILFSGEFPFFCKLCPKTFMNRSNCNHHVATTHKYEVEARIMELGKLKAVANFVGRNF